MNSQKWAHFHNPLTTSISIKIILILRGNNEKIDNSSV